MLEGHHGVVPRDAEVVAVAHRHHRQAALAGLFDAAGHGVMAGHVPQPLVGVQAQGDGGFVEHGDGGFRVHQPAADARAVVRVQADDAVRTHPAQVGGDEHVGHDGGVLRGDCVALQEADDVVTQVFGAVGDEFAHGALRCI